VPSRKSKETLNPELVKRLCRAIRRYPNITAAADACGVNPRQLQQWIKRGLYPNPEPCYGALANAARRSLAICKGKLWETLFVSATGYVDADGRPVLGDPKWAAYLMEQMKEEGDLPWNSTIPDAGDMPAVRKHLFQNPSPQLLQDIHDAGFKMVPLEPTDPPLQLTAAQGELVDDDE
jgi:hypothetical protein